MTKTLLKSALLTSILMAMPASAIANEYDDALNNLCKKTKSCAMKQMEGAEGMSDDMKAMVMQSLNSMCSNMESSFAASLAYPDLMQSAAACMRSMSKQTCESFDSGDAEKTPECINFRENAKKFE